LFDRLRRRKKVYRLVSFQEDGGLEVLRDFPKPITPSEVENVVPGVCYGLLEIDAKTQKTIRTLWQETIIPKELFDQAVTRAQAVVTLEKEKFLETSLAQAQSYLEKKKEEERLKEEQARQEREKEKMDLKRLRLLPAAWEKFTGLHTIDQVADEVGLSPIIVAQVYEMLELIRLKGLYPVRFEDVERGYMVKKVTI